MGRPWMCTVTRAELLPKQGCCCFILLGSLQQATLERQQEANMQHACQVEQAGASTSCLQLLGNMHTCRLTAPNHTCNGEHALLGVPYQLYSPQVAWPVAS